MLYIMYERAQGFALRYRFIRICEAKKKPQINAAV